MWNQPAIVNKLAQYTWKIISFVTKKANSTIKQQNVKITKNMADFFEI